MYIVEFFNKNMGKTETISYGTFKRALFQYIECLQTPFWHCDISDLKIKKNNRDITAEVNKFMAKKWRG